MRIIGCTTTAAAKYTQQLRDALPEVLLVEEAGEILESHVLTALGEETRRLILIGDHKYVVIPEMYTRTNCRNVCKATTPQSR